MYSLFVFATMLTPLGQTSVRVSRDAHPPGLQVDAMRGASVTVTCVDRFEEPKNVMVSEFVWRCMRGPACNHTRSWCWKYDRTCNLTVDLADWAKLMVEHSRPPRKPIEGGCAKNPRSCSPDEDGRPMYPSSWAGPWRCVPNP